MLRQSSTLNRFADIEDSFEPLEALLNEVARPIDSAIQLAVEHQENMHPNCVVSCTVAPPTVLDTPFYFKRH
jgi:hypothetical protein